MLAGSDAFVLPCIVTDDGDRDGIPNVLVEAMAMMLPVITTGVSGIPELVSHNRTGLIVPERNPVALAGAIRNLIADTRLALDLARAGMEATGKHMPGLPAEAEGGNSGKLSSESPEGLETRQEDPRMPKIISITSAAGK